MFKNLSDSYKTNAHLVFKLAKSDLIKTYRGAALGWGWAIIKPTVSIMVYWIVFAVGLGFGGDKAGVPYILWLEAGLIPWFYMSEMISQGMGSLRSYRFLITKMKFPVYLIPVFVGLSKLFVHIGLMIIVVAMFAIFKIFPDIYFLQIFYYMAVMYVFFVAWAVLSSPLATISKDFANLVRSFIPAVLWLSGVIWDPTAVQNRYFKLMLSVNPVTYIAQGYRDSLIYHVWFFEKRETIYFFIVLFMIVIASIYIFRKLRKDIPDVL